METTDHQPASDFGAAQSTGQNPAFRVVMALIAMLCALYLVSIPLGWVDQRLGVPEVMLLTVMLLFGSGFIFSIEEFAFGEKGVNFKIRQVQERQDFQEREIAQLRFLLTHFLTRYEVKHLRKLAGDDPFPFDHCTQGSRFWEELFRLRQHGMLQSKAGYRMSELPSSGPDLRAHLEITPAGRKYLELRGTDENDE